MTTYTDSQDLFVTNVAVDGRTYDVHLVVGHDGIEHVGHLWFVDSDWDDDEGFRDHGALPGRSPNEVLASAQALSEADLLLRYRRALVEKRRFVGLRKITEDVLTDIRYLNKVATSMRAGLLAIEEAAAEIDSTEQRLHDMIGQLRHFAGVPA